LLTRNLAAFNLDSDSWEATLRKRNISLALLILTSAFVTMPVKAAPAGSAPLGIVMQANSAQVSSDTVTSGATVFDGDSLSTGAGGALQVRFGNSQAYLLPNSSVSVHQGAAGFGGTLNGGTVVLSSTGADGFNLLADGATLRPAGTQPTTAQITMVNSHELNLVSQKGALEISMDGQTQTVPEGSSYRMVVEPGAAAGPQRKGGAASGGVNHFLLFALALVGVGVGVGLWLALVSPDKP
jgi:hypothetical protein